MVNLKGLNRKKSAFNGSFLFISSLFVLFKTYSCSEGVKFL